MNLLLLPFPPRPPWTSSKFHQPPPFDRIVESRKYLWEMPTKYSKHFFFFEISQSREKKKAENGWTRFESFGTLGPTDSPITIYYCTFPNSGLISIRLIWKALA